jgi:CheY-like chemotaxis protein
MHDRQTSSACVIFTEMNAAAPGAGDWRDAPLLPAGAQCAKSTTWLQRGHDSQAMLGKHILNVEDEPLIAMVIEDMLEMLGCRCSTAGDLAAALALAEAVRFDAAVIDINLGAARSWPVARLLTARGTPFVLVTGDTGRSLPDDLAGSIVVAKPYSIDALVDVLRDLVPAGDPIAGDG